jgi:hypothetical protein
MAMFKQIVAASHWHTFRNLQQRNRRLAVAVDASMPRVKIVCNKKKIQNTILPLPSLR